jgi:DNA ligase-associated metallophosphoesterase
MQITIKEKSIKLLIEKAAIWLEEKTLIISDMHLGKISHFRKAGIALPAKAAEHNFNILDNLILSNNIWRIIFTGDLFHSDKNEEWDTFCRWRRKYHSVEMHIVPGNHDRFDLKCYADVPLIVHQDEYIIDDFVFTHHPRIAKENEYIFCGHVHPVIKVPINSATYRLPCFYISEQQMIMPSFGYFTGGYVIQPIESEKVIAVVNKELIDVSLLYTA